MIKAASLFSGAGIGEYYLNELGIDIVLANEVVKSRAVAHSFIYPDCDMIVDDITKESVQEEIINKCKKEKVKLIIATPPCQGVSTAGSNKQENKLFKDPRNFLVLSALNIVDKVKPDYVLIENVPRFQQMLFPYRERVISLEELLNRKYSDEYELDCRVFNAADYNVPQTRYRVVYRLWRKGLQWQLPEKRGHQVTLKEAIGDLPSIEPGQDSGIKNHYAKPHPENHIECMRHTPSGMSAFKNQIYYPKKPDGSRITGYGNSYKRMRWDYPAPTITMRNEIVSSQENVHPGRPLPDELWSDARVLTLRELLIVSSLPPEMDIPSNLTDTAFRQLIGEGIPPQLLKEIMRGIVSNE
ncbi:MAG: DNA cytosine methyltransferase [Erysipelotrichaceae bacterium]|nr:DNA cytosine methyltransferase [Erysipelotrichaceae bacterium]